jgi:hypothetical protein
MSGNGQKFLLGCVMGFTEFRLRDGTHFPFRVMSNVHAMTQAFLADGRSESFDEGSLSNPEINRLMKRS